MMWINGQTQSTLSATDRGVQFGDGCFTTAAVYHGRVILIAMHLARLQEGCARLKINGIDWQRLEQEMRQAASQQQQCVLKVILTRGEGGRGYRSPVEMQATRIVSLAPWPEQYAGWRCRGARLLTSSVMLARNPLLAGIKHLNRLEQVLIRQQFTDSQADEVLVSDTAGNLIECCAANIFWRTGNYIYTPRLDQAGVDGIMRRYLLDRLETAGYICQQVTTQPVTLRQADEVFICNALLPVMPVCQIDDHVYLQRQLADRLFEQYQQLELV